FTNPFASQTITNQHDGNGNLTNRIWLDASGHTNRIQTLTWDAFDRLVKETLRDSWTNGYDRVCLYDGLGRRVRTTHTVIISNVLQVPLDIDSFYDPTVEFLEVDLATNEQHH